MGKSSRVSNKSTIAKDKLCDEDFDKLVVDTSHRVTRKNQPTSTNQASSLVEQQARSSNNQVLPHSSICLTDQPKRPMNAFMVWGQAIRRELHDRFSNVQNALLSKALGRVWRSLDPADKEPYIRKANLIKANHKRDYPNYRYRPRRIQEKRTKCNMLIGIHLNHPVNQHPKQTNYNFDQTLQSAYQADCRFAQQSNCLKQQRYINFRVSRDPLSSSDPELEISKDTRQPSYGYEPYSGSLHLETTSNNGHCHTTESYQEYQQQFSVASKQPTEFTYPPYHQLAYNVHHQHYQHQPTYELSSQAAYLDSRATSRIPNNTNTGSFCPNITEINQVKMYDQSSYNHNYNT